MQETSTGSGASRRPADVLLAGGTLADAAGMGPRQLEAIYSLAFQEMEQRHYADAEKTLRALCLASHNSTRYWMALGACRQKMGSYEDAVYAYSMVAELGHPDPMAPLRAAECYLMLGLYEEAVSGIEAALALAPYADDPLALVQHLEVLVQALEKASGGDNPKSDPASR
jgi:type III secretion system low calcium response chaperone LcrH/SycD